LNDKERVIILVYPKNKEEINLIAQRIVDEVKNQMYISGHLIQSGASIGISVFPDDEKDKEKLMHKADLALYEAKRDGRNTFKFYKQKLE